MTLTRERALGILTAHQCAFAPPSLDVLAELHERNLTFDGILNAEVLRGYALGTRVELCYFKGSGKYYSSSEFMSFRSMWHEMLDDVRSMQFAGTLPGLVEGCREFDILIQPGEPWCVPHIIRGQR